jgi:hypothetical protein
MIKKKVTVAKWVEVPQYGSMMRKMKMKKKGLCFKYGKKGDKARRPETTEKELRVKMMNMEMDSNTFKLGRIRRSRS